MNCKEVTANLNATLPYLRCQVVEGHHATKSVHKEYHQTVCVSNSHQVMASTGCLFKTEVSRRDRFSAFG